MQTKELLSAQEVNFFKQKIWDYFRDSGRTFVWRDTDNPYHVVVSEIMLQQTQTYRVDGKFQQFVKQFPSFAHLANAPLQQILLCWQGLGYNRRALALQKIAQIIVNDYQETLPNDPNILINFPGIGPATASSICAFAFNKPVFFIETNIRSVYLHHFFPNQSNIDDKQILPLIEVTLDRQNPRHWYYALMDYGVMLKKKLPNPSRRSKHHHKQSKFEGSDRQVRGAILKLLSTNNRQIGYQELQANFAIPAVRLDKIITALIKDNLIAVNKDCLVIK